jgi:uncharacterized protein
MQVVADTGPLLAAANRRDHAHGLAAALVSRLGSNLLVPDPVLVEADALLRGRVGAHAARLLLSSVAAGAHRFAAVGRGLMRRAVAIDERYADLGLGYTDSVVMALAERHRLPILTFDFTHFRAAPPLDGGHWRLVVDERRFRDSGG